MVAGITAATPRPSLEAADGATGSTARIADDTAETVPDTATTLAQEYSRRAEVILLATASAQQTLQLRLDRMRADFNAQQEERSEQMREMNALRDMAIEQSKKDDDILKKFIAMI